MVEGNAGSGAALARSATPTENWAARTRSPYLYAMVSRCFGSLALLAVACAPASCPPCEANAPAPPCAISASPQTPAVLVPATGDATGETRTREVIASVVARNRHLVRACYDAGRAKDPRLAGTLTIHFTIDPQGKVTEASVVDARTTLKAGEVHRCALDALRTISFPPSSRGFESQVNYPFDFKP
jgi:TonB family protein